MFFVENISLQSKQQFLINASLFYFNESMFLNCVPRLKAEKYSLTCLVNNTKRKGSYLFKH